MEKQEIILEQNLKLFFSDNYINLKHGDVLYPCRSITKATDVICGIYDRGQIPRQTLLDTLDHLSTIKNFAFGGINQIKIFNLFCKIANKPTKKLVEELPIFQLCDNRRYEFVNSGYKSDPFDSKESAIDQLYIALYKDVISESAFFKLLEMIPFDLPEETKMFSKKKVLLN